VWRADGNKNEPSAFVTADPASGATVYRPADASCTTSGQSTTNVADLFDVSTAPAVTQVRTSAICLSWVSSFSTRWVQAQVICHGCNAGHLNPPTFAALHQCLVGPGLPVSFNA
jgi:hypothetical protein